jgi:radical SAM/Cys-rich protein
MGQFKSLQSLKKRQSPLAQTERQLKILEEGIFASGEAPMFGDKIQQSLGGPLKTTQLDILQVNLGYMCNQVCAHCHVDAGPDRKEIMTQETMELCLKVMESSGVHTLDLTGGAPEMNPNFRWFVTQAKAKGVKEIIVRSNLTIIVANKNYHDLPEFFAQHQVHVVSSMPHWTKEKTDRQRGSGVFEDSIKALKMLNAVGYGMPESALVLDLVYNPSGAFLPADQDALCQDFKRRLDQSFGIQFNELFALTNLPISRFLDYLIASDNYEEYMWTLVDSFNPNAARAVMCLNTLSISWEGYLYDCDFNQMLQIPINDNRQHISNYEPDLMDGRLIKISQHCYGCTAGAGSSCQGAVT